MRVKMNKKVITILIIIILIVLAGIGVYCVVRNNHKIDEANENNTNNDKNTNEIQSNSVIDEETNNNIQQNEQNRNVGNIDSTNTNNSLKGNITNREENMKLYIKVNNRTLTATLVDNSSTRALIERLESSDITISMSDYGNMEKVGGFGFSLPTNNENINTEAGDLILYQGNSFVIYYDTNSWNFTRLGKLDNVNQRELKDILGNGNVNVTLSLSE